MFNALSRKLADLKYLYSLTKIWWHLNWAEFLWINVIFSFEVPSYFDQTVNSIPRIFRDPDNMAISFFGWTPVIELVEIVKIDPFFSNILEYLRIKKVVFSLLLKAVMLFRVNIFKSLNYYFRFRIPMSHRIRKSRLLATTSRGLAQSHNNSIL